MPETIAELLGPTRENGEAPSQAPAAEVSDELRDRLNEAMADDPALWAAWGGETPEGGDKNRSAFDIKLAGALRRHGGFTLQDFATLARWWPYGKGADGDPRHWRRTWEKAKPNGSSTGATLAPLVGLALEDFVACDLPPRPVLLAPWLTKSTLAMIHAKTGVGKTWLSLSIAHAVATGGYLLKWPAPEPRKVVYLDGEMSGAMMQDRGRALLDGGTTAGRLIIVNPDLQPDPMPNLATPRAAPASSRCWPALTSW